MRLPVILLVVLLAMLAVLGYLFAVEPPASTGVLHPEIGAMLRGGDGLARHGPILGAVWLFGLLVIALFVTLLIFGVRRHGTVGPAGRALAAGGALYAATFCALMWTYRAWLHDPSDRQLFSFPVPSAWMLYGISALPLVFVALYVLRFDRWILPPDELEAFVRRARAGRAGDGETR